MGFSRQEYWSGLPCPSPGDLPNPEIKLWVLYTSTIWEAHLSPYEILYGRPFLSTDLLVNPETHYLVQYLLVLGLTLKNVWEYQDPNQTRISQTHLKTYCLVIEYMLKLFHRIKNR